MTEIERVLSLYLYGLVGLDYLRDWMALHQWDLDAEGQKLADQVDAALVQYGDGYISESDVRAWLAYVLNPWRNVIARHIYSYASPDMRTSEYVVIGFSAGLGYHSSSSAGSESRTPAPV